MKKSETEGMARRGWEAGGGFFGGCWPRPRRAAIIFPGRLAPGRITVLRPTRGAPYATCSGDLCGVSGGRPAGGGRRLRPGRGPGEEGRLEHGQDYRQLGVGEDG